MKRRILCTMLALCLAVALAGCSLVMKLFQDEETDALMLKAMAALTADDTGALEALFVPGVLPWEPGKPNPVEENGVYSGAVVSWRCISVSKQQQAGGQAAVHAEYEVETDTGGRYHVSVASKRLADGTFGLEQLIVSKLGEGVAPGVPAGSLSGIAFFSAAQWLLLAYSAACYAFIIFTIVKCVRAPLKNKPLLVLLIAIQVAVGVAGGSGVSVNVGSGIHVLSYSRLLIWPDGAYNLRLLLPLGAVVYWGIRKRLPQKDTPPPPVGQAASPYGQPWQQPQAPVQPPLEGAPPEGGASPVEGTPPTGGAPPVDGTPPAGGTPPQDGAPPSGPAPG